MKPSNTIYAIIVFIIGIVTVQVIDSFIIKQSTMGIPEENLQWWLYSMYILLVSIVPARVLQWRLESKMNKENTLLVLSILSLVFVSVVIGVTPFINQLYFIELLQIGISNVMLLTIVLVSTLFFLTKSKSTLRRDA